MTNQKLFDEFKPISTEQWEGQINVDLKGADYDKKLVWKTIDGLNIKPYFRTENIEDKEYLNRNPSEFPFVRGVKKDSNEWEIKQDFIVKDPIYANKQILEAIQKGATSIGIKICKKEIDSFKKFKAIIENIDLTKIPIHIRAGKGSPIFLNYLIEITKEKGINDKVKGTFGYDPLGHLSYKGGFYDNEKNDFESLSDVLLKAKKYLPEFKVIGVNGSNFGNAGASIIQELAFSLSMANEYMSKLTELGNTSDDIASSINFTFSIGSNYFLEIAKIRAGRILWATIVNEYKPTEINAGKMYVHAETQEWNKTSFDPYVNMLRTTTESMSATIAGVDSLTVKPFNKTFEQTSPFSERIARNSQVILKEEAYLDKVVDPSAGSYYIENLTDSIAEETWNLFNEIENEGGYISSFKKGVIQQKVENIAEKRNNLIATRREVLVGTNQYPNYDEKIAEKINHKISFEDIEPFSDLFAKPLKMFRGASDIEKLRLRTEKNDHRPNVFMLTMGNLTMRKARSAFASNFFACAGYQLIDNLGFASVEEGVKASINAKSDIVVVCSSDDEYAEYAPQIFNMIKGKAIVVVAGSPSCKEELKKAGIQHFIHMKSNVLETLESFHKLLGIK